MDQSRKTPIPASKSHLLCANSTPPDFQRRMGFWKEFEETNENECHPQITFTPISASASTKRKKKILGERNSDDFPSAPKEKLVMGFERIEAHPQETDLFPSGPRYDPVNNYTSPRPAFLRYNPDRHREILLRLSNEEGSDADSGVSMSPTSPKLSSHEAEVEDFEDEEAEGRRPWCLRTVWNLLLLFGVFLVSYHCLFPMSSTSSLLQENVSSSKNSLDRNLLMAHVGVSDVCLDIGEEMCGIGGPISDFGEVVGALDSEKYEELVDENGEVLDFEEANEEPVSFHESFVQEESEEEIEILSESVEDLEIEELESESPILSETSSKDGNLIFILMSLLTATNGLLTCLIYYASSHQNSSQLATPSPVTLPTDKPADDWRAGEDSNVNEHKESLIEVKDSSNPADELKGFYAMRQPTVELIGEFSVAYDLSSRSAPSKRLKRDGFEASAEAKPSLSSAKTQPGSEKKEDATTTPAKKTEKAVATTTPARRSSRLRNRVTSPTP